MKVRIAVVAAVLALVLSTSVFAATVKYTMVDLGTLGGASSEAYGVNNSGYVVGYSSNGTLPRAFIYKPGIGMQDLGTTAGSATSARAINNAGQITGVDSNCAFRYTPGVGFQNLGTLRPYTGSCGYGINSDGHVTGTGMIGAADTTPFLQIGAGQMTSLGLLGSYAQAYGINSSDMVVGIYAEPSGSYHRQAFYWTSQTGIQPMVTTNGYEAQAFAVNDSCQVTGWLGDSGYIQHAFVWQNGQYTRIGSLMGSFGYSVGRGINSSGQIVGESVWSFSANTNHAFLYTPGAGMTDLGALVSGYSTIATSISDNGYIAGYGYVNSTTRHAVMWVPTTVPEPSALLALTTGLGLLGLPILRRR